MPDDPPPLVREADAAEYLGVSRTKLRQLGLRRKVLGGKRLYHKPDLDAYIANLPYHEPLETTNTADLIEW